ncbi:LytR C-terminal domain-containing protein [Sphingomonas sp.]|uniref:LytR C-terminal domain-containing protein n=1 Tax=Sphingomonas sp. TaxID=28214 RepID=UPI00181E948F|nr:LytR C-terminal domain-containing protein [Sphingomonas sp.]MBA3511803.1 LytR C-terminal domain-containing protein [Sphingomonas sp.]
MNGGARFLATAAVLALAGCGGSDAKLEIRSTPTPLSATSKPTPHRIAEAHGHLALGNVALAIESFRKALREQPDSVDAMVGLAASYDRMTRFDLSRRYYESALAIVPADTRVLNAFARSLDVQGRSVEAAAVRSEIRTRSAAADVRPAPAIQAPARQQKLAQALPPVAAPSVTIKLPPPRGVATVVVQRPAEPKVRASAPPAKLEPKVAAVPASPPAPVAVARKPVEPKAAPLPVAAPIMASAKPEPTKAPVQAAVVQRPVETKPMASPPPAAAVAFANKTAATKAAVPPATAAPAVVAIKPVEVKTPAPAPAAPVRVARKPVMREAAPALAAPAPIAAPRKPVELAAKLPSVPAAPIATTPVEVAAVPPQPAPAPVALEPVAVAQATPPARSRETQAGPRLERLSLGEVALITTGRPHWRSEVVSRTAQSTTVRFVPLRKADARPVRIRLLNAARHEGLAARTRRLLVQRGWRQLAIGNARHIRRSSLVLYPASQRTLAKRLAAQFGIALAENADGTDLIVLLGRDAARRNPARGG